jgi:transcription elongation factor Elf1
MINVRLAVRPVRVGFVVGHGDFDALWRAVRFNTCLWGGYFNPIVPVRPADLLSDEERGFFDPPLADYLVRIFEVDLLERLSEDESCNAFVEARGHLKRPHGPGLVYDEGTPNQHLSLLDVQPVLRALANSRQSQSRWAIQSQPLEGWRESFVRITCGDPDGTELGGTTLRAAYAQIRPSEHIVRDGVPLSLHLVTDPWPIHLSTVGLERFAERSGWSNSGVFVGDATDFDDLVAFWNLRAAGKSLIFMPTQAMGDAMPLARAHAERLTRSRPDPWDGPSVWHLREKHDAAANEVKEALGIEEQAHDGHVWNGRNIKPARVARAWETVLAHLRQTYEESAWVEAQLPQLAFDRSLLRGRNGTQKVALDADVTDFTVGGERMTLRVPPLPNMNEFLGRGLDGLRVKREHVSILQYAETSVCHLSPVTFRAAMREVLAHCGFKIKDSVPGKYSRRVLELMGGVGGCRVLKVPGVRKLLREKAAQTGIGGPNAQQVIADRDATTKQPSFKDLGIYLDGERCTEQVALRHLVRKGVLVPGAALECPKCGERTWYSMTRMRAWVKCDCCGATSDTAVRLGTRIDIKFKVAPLWRKADVQYGVIPVILALWRLEEQHRMGAGRYLTSAEVSGGGVEMEVDFLGLIEERDKRPMLLVGECKNTHERDVKEMKAKVEKLKAWYDAIERAGVKACIAFVTTERSFDSDLLKECESMVTEGRRVLLLTARELDPYFAFSGESDDVPFKYAGSMWELCANSRVRYLRRDDSPTEG